MTNWMRVTVACPVAHVSDANELAMCVGYSEADGQTFSQPNYEDADGNLYAVASGLVKPQFVQDAVSPLVEPEWGADMEAAGRAQALIVLNDAASPSVIAAVVDDDVGSALTTLNLYQIVLDI